MTITTLGFEFIETVMLAKAGIQPSGWNRESSKLTHYRVFALVEWENDSC